MKNYNDAATSTVTGTNATHTTMTHSDSTHEPMMVATDPATHEFSQRRHERLKMETGYVMMAADGSAIAMVPKQVN